jgi:hypothetical protein
VLAAFITGAIEVPGFSSLPAGAFVGLVLLLVALPLLTRRWDAALAVFLGWLVIEDLVRKLAGNDIRVYFLKDGFLIALYIAMARTPEAKSAWARATGGARLCLYALLAWTIVTSVPSFQVDWREPLLGLRLDFLYAPLVVAGVLIAGSRSMLSRFLQLSSVVGAAACSIGILQAIAGPSFLSPQTATPGLTQLVLIRGTPASGDVYRPTGTFVSSGRFLSMALIVMTLALVWLLLSEGVRRLLPLLCAVTAAAAVWISGGRAGLLIAALILVAALIAPTFSAGRPMLRSSVLAVASASVALLLIAILLPGLFASRLVWYSQTLDPRSSTNEWLFRWDAYAGGAAKGVEVGGLVGQGTGSESLGKQYIFGGTGDSSEGLYQVESGFGAVAIENGVIGLGLFCLWIAAWLWRAWTQSKAARGSPLAGAGLVVLAWMLYVLVIGFFTGLAAFQNFTTNAYFWLLSGLVFSLPVLRDRSSQLEAVEK